MPGSAKHRMFMLLACVISIQAATAQQAPPPDIKVSTNLVVVPTLVLAANGELTHQLTASDFKLFDNGVPQKVVLQEQEHQPLAIVVVLQTGGAASHDFEYFSGLPAMLDALTGTSPHRVALLTFDSQPEYEWDFTPRVSDFAHDLSHPERGDNGAAVLDAVDHGIDMLAKQPSASRRILLLISQPQDDGSRTKAEDVVRRLGRENITIYSVTFSPEKKWLKEQFAGERVGNKPYHLSDQQPEVLYTFDLLTPLMKAVNAMRTDAAGEIAALSGGESMRFHDRHDFDQELADIANHIPNRYMLTFTPSVSQPGFHALRVEIPHDPGLSVSARTSYWLSGSE